MKKRKLTEDDIELWKKVAHTAERLHPGKAPAPVTAPEAAAKPPKPGRRDKTLPPAPKPALQPFELGARAAPKAQAGRPRFDLQPTPAERLATAPVRMDGKSFKKMKRGKIKPEAKLDLHGMRVEAAHGALRRFILSAHGSGKRLVLVVTGKGKHRDEPGPIPVPRGVLRHQVPQWLALPPLHSVVLQVTAAHISHGGEGAYYVYLRKSG